MNEEIKEQVKELLANKRYTNLYQYMEKLNSQDIIQLFNRKGLLVLDEKED